MKTLIKPQYLILHDPDKGEAFGILDIYKDDMYQFSVSKKANLIRTNNFDDITIEYEESFHNDKAVEWLDIQAQLMHEAEKQKIVDDLNRYCPTCGQER